MAQLQEFHHALAVGLVAGLGIGHGLPQVLEDVREVRLELLLGLAELPDFGQFIVEEWCG